MDGYRSAPFLAVFDGGIAAAGGLGASSASLPFSEGSSADVIQLPGMTPCGVFFKDHTRIFTLCDDCNLLFSVLV